jgi:pimeloyl-ACP methyl ester carboxylesterase
MTKTVQAYALSCEQLSQPSGILHFIGTREAVQDWEQLRLALGYDKIHWLGASYGTYYGQEYAYTFPNNVGRFVMDAVAAHGMPDLDQAKADLLSLNRLLLRADAWCHLNETCPYYSKPRGSVVDVRR